MATYAYLIDPENQFMTKSGTINTAGILRVYDASTDDPVITYKDFMGTENEEAIVLDNNGRAIVIADSDRAYRLEVYDRYNTLLWTTTPLWCQAGGGGASFSRTEIVSSDGSVEITKTTVGSTTTFDLSTDVEDGTDLLEWIRCEGNEIHDGVYTPLYVSGTMEVLDDGIGMFSNRYYHVTAHIKCNKPVTPQPFYDDVKVHFVGRDLEDPTDEYTFQSFKLDVDYAMAMPQVFEVSTDIIALNDFELLIKIDDVEISGATFEVSDIVVHRVFSGSPALPGGAASKPWVEENFQEKLIPGTGITIDENNVISATAAQQQQADWDQANTGDVTYIRNKPDLSVYATKEEVDEGLDEKQDVLTAGDNIVIENNVISATVDAQVNSDWDATSGVAEILNKPDLSIYATQSDLEDKQDVLTPGDNITIVNNVISATAEPQVNADWEATSGVAEILNKPDLSIYAEKTDLEDYQPLLTPGEGITIENNVISATGGSFEQVNADWDATSGVAEILNKPEEKNLVAGTNISIAENNGDIVISASAAPQVNADWNATSGVAEILNKPTIPAAQVNSDWEATEGVAEILNKPEEVQLVAGANITIAESSNQIVISATANPQVNADWDATSGVAQILHKPTLSSVATSGSYNDLTDKPTIPAAQVNSDWNASTGVAAILNKPTLSSVATSGSYNDLTNKLVAGNNITIDANNVISATGGGTAQVNSDWEATSGVAEILNKPTEKTLVGGSNVSITEDNDTVTISAVAAAQVNADWNATSGVAEILNKPVIPAAQVNSDWEATAGVAEILNKPDEVQLVAGSNISIAESGNQIVISASSAPAQVNADWNATSGAAQILNKPDLSVYATTAAMNTALAGKQDTISDLATIRSGAAAGATAVQPSALATVATTGSYTDLSNKPSIPVIGTITL